MEEAQFVYVQGDEPLLTRVLDQLEKPGGPAYLLEEENGKQLWAYVQDTDPAPPGDPAVAAWNERAIARILNNPPEEASKRGHLGLPEVPQTLPPVFVRAAQDIRRGTLSGETLTLLDQAPVRTVKAIYRYDGPYVEGGYIFAATNLKKAVRIVLDTADLARLLEGEQLPLAFERARATYYIDIPGYLRKQAKQAQEEQARAASRQAVQARNTHRARVKEDLAPRLVADTDPNLHVYIDLLEAMHRKDGETEDVLERQRPKLRERGRALLYQLYTHQLAGDAHDLLTNTSNRSTRAFFQRITGTALPSTQRGTGEALGKYEATDPRSLEPLAQLTWFYGRLLPYLPSNVDPHTVQTLGSLLYAKAPLEDPKKPMEYRYGAMNRPPGLGSSPPGYLRIDPPLGASAGEINQRMTRFGILVYPRPLTAQEIKDWELYAYMPAEEIVRRVVERAIEAGEGPDYGAYVRGHGPDDEQGQQQIWDMIRDLRVYTEEPWQPITRAVLVELERRFPSTAAPDSKEALEEWLKDAVRQERAHQRAAGMVYQERSWLTDAKYALAHGDLPRAREIRQAFEAGAFGHSKVGPSEPAASAPAAPLTLQGAKEALVAYARTSQGLRGPAKVSLANYLQMGVDAPMSVHMLALGILRPMGLPDAGRLEEAFRTALQDGRTLGGGFDAQAIYNPHASGTRKLKGGASYTWSPTGGLLVTTGKSVAVATALRGQGSVNLKGIARYRDPNTGDFTLVVDPGRLSAFARGMNSLGYEELATAVDQLRSYWTSQAAAQVEAPMVSTPERGAVPVEGTRWEWDRTRKRIKLFTRQRSYDVARQIGGVARYTYDTKSDVPAGGVVYYVEIPLDIPAAKLETTLAGVTQQYPLTGAAMQEHLSLWQRG